MTLASIRDLLAAEAVFGDFEPADLDLLAGCGRNEAYAAGAVLVHEGEAADRFFVVRHGRLAVEIHGPGGALVVDTAGPGDLVGWSWLVPPHRWTADVRALDDARVVALDGTCLRTKCEAEPAFGYRMMHRFARVMSQSLEHARLQLADLYGGARAG